MDLFIIFLDWTTLLFNFLKYNYKNYGAKYKSYFIIFKFKMSFLTILKIKDNSCKKQKIFLN